MEQTWRWFGPQDPITLAEVAQTGATGIVTALHDVEPGQVWPMQHIEARRNTIAAAGLRWSVVESVPVSEDIKTRGSAWRLHIDAYCDTLRNLARCGLRTVCYNFMPVLEWTRTDLNWRLPDGALGLRFEATAFAAFDLFVLRRNGAEEDWPDDLKRAAYGLFKRMTPAAIAVLTRTILAGLPGTDTGYDLGTIQRALERYRGIDAAALRANLGEFLRAVCPVAEACGVRLCIHPDDPPRPMLGLPRIVSTGDDLAFLLRQTPETSNGITFCTGSFGVRADNDLPAMAKQFASRIWFAHLRSTRREADGESFIEAAHLDGDVDMTAVINELLMEERRRQAEDPGASIPFRPDHGHQLLSDQTSATRPGYPLLGRMRGLAELRGIIYALEGRKAAI